MLLSNNTLTIQCKWAGKHFLGVKKRENYFLRPFINIIAITKKNSSLEYLEFTWYESGIIFNQTLWTTGKETCDLMLSKINYKNYQEYFIIVINRVQINHQWSLMQSHVRNLRELSIHMLFPMFLPNEAAPRDRRREQEQAGTEVV